MRADDIILAGHVVERERDQCAVVIIDLQLDDGCNGVRHEMTVRPHGAFRLSRSTRRKEDAHGVIFENAVAVGFRAATLSDERFIVLHIGPGRLLK